MENFDYIKNTIVITNRNLVKGDYLTQIERVAKLKPHALILREKDLSDEEYYNLARQVKQICDDNQVVMYVHSKLDIAQHIGCKAVHMSVATLENCNKNYGLHNSNTGIKSNSVDCTSKHKNHSFFKSISVSCHSLEDVQKAISGGATQIILGTIFETDCKKGLKGKGLEFVREIAEYCREHGNVPVYAIGGIKPENLDAVIEAGASGGCMMSYMMEL